MHPVNSSQLSADSSTDTRLQVNTACPACEEKFTAQLSEQMLMNDYLTVSFA